nr:poly [ADP-ribose] polymerase 1 [Crypthecodinium cohnii]
MAPKRAPAAEDFSKLTVAELKERLTALGSSTSGAKGVLVDRLKALTEAKASAKAKPEAKARGKAKAKAKEEAEEEEAPPAPKRGAKAKAKAEAEPTKRAAPKAKAEAEEPPAKRAKAAAASPAKGSKRNADGDVKTSQQEEEPEDNATISGPSEVFYEDGVFSAEYAKSNRSKCTKCKKPIEMGTMRIGKSQQSDKFDGMYTAWQHFECLVKGGVLPKSTQIIAGYGSLKGADQDLIASKVPSEAAGGAAESEELKAQSKKLHEIMDVLNQLSDKQHKEMLELNNLPSQKFGDKAASKVEMIADGILFGAPQPCEVCEGALILSGEGYRCRGWVSEFLKCTFKTQTPSREVWELSEAAKSAGGGKLKKMKLKTGDRIFYGELRDDDEIAAAASSQKRPAFLGHTFVVLERGDTLSKEELEEMIKKNGGSIADNITKVAYCVISHGGVVEKEEEEDEDHEGVAKATKLQVCGVGENFVTESIEAGEMMDLAPYILWGEPPRRKQVAEGQTSRFIEKMGVNMDADVGEEIAQQAHVLVDKSKKRVYSEMLTRTDVATGANSFYTMHLLESDDASSRKYWVFRKWGRIGVSQGGTKLQEFPSLQSAINDFSKQFYDKTGNQYSEASSSFVVKTGKFVRIELEHKALGKKKAEGADGDQGGQQGGGNDQPLGKLSKSQIEKGDAVLDKVEATINDSSLSAAKQLATCQALSAEFYTMIPHNFGAKKPPVINNTELLGAEKALLQFYLRMGFEEMGGEEEEKLTPIQGVMELPVPATLHESAHMVCSVKDIKSCVTKGTTMHKKKAGKPQKPMTPDLYGSILLYTSNAIYKQLNKALRDEDRTTVEKYFPYLRFLFEACDRLPQQKRTLWRGVGVDLFSQYKVGSTIVWWGVSSCTSDEKVARNFMAGCGAGATLLTVEVSTACDISEVSFYANEAESILLPGTKLEVLSSKKTGNKSEIALREVGRVVS